MIPSPTKTTPTAEPTDVPTSAAPREVRALDYLVGGLRISLAPRSTTPGPRNHILGVVAALRAEGVKTKVFVASEQPLLGRFAGIPEGSASGGAVRRLCLDVVRLAAAAWSLVRVWIWSRSSTADVIYERAAVLQCLGLVHRRRRSALYVVESNAIFSRETALDRQALGSTRLAAALERAVYRRADAVVVVSQRLRDEVCAFAGVPPHKVLVLPNAVPDAAFAVSAAPKDSGCIVGFAGAVVPWQRVDLLLRAAAPLVDAGLSVEILGEGPEVPALRALADELGIADHVAFLSRHGHDQALRRMAGWTAGYAGHAASSSRSMYHSPLKLYEYAGIGLHLVAKRTADSEELQTEGVPVHFIEDDTVEAVRAALIGLLREPARTREDVAASRARLRERHSWSHRVNTLLNHCTRRPECPPRSKR